MSESCRIQILHVDDEADLRELVATFLERENDRFEVETVASVSAGRDRLSEAEFDCIVSDYDLPGEDGIEFLETVRSRDPELPFILYTGKGSEEIASEAVSAGVTDYLQKDTGTDQYTLLANRVSNAVRRSRAEQQVSQTRSQIEAIVENTTDAILTIDAESVIRFANPAVESVFGYEPAELQGEPLTTLMPSRFHADHHSGVARYLETGEQSIDWSSIELPGEHREGHEIPLSISFSEFTENGEQRFIGVIREQN